VRFLIVILFFNIFLIANAVKVAVAANVSYAMEDLIKEFNKSYPAIKILTTISSSGKLTAQIKSGAPYEIFLSANMDYPEVLFKKQFSKYKPKVYAKGSIAILTTKNIDLKNGLKALLNSKIKKIAIANDKTAPYGVATKEALVNLKLYSKLKPKFIYGQSIGQTLLYTINAADIGIVAKSLLYSKKMSKYKEKKNWISIDKKLYKPIEQGLILLKGASDDAKIFYEFLLSNKAKVILKNYGYIF